MKTVKELKYIDIVSYYGTCDFCKERCVIVAHYNYSNQPKDSYRLCPICMGRGLIASTSPLMTQKFAKLRFERNSENSC